MLFGVLTKKLALRAGLIGWLAVMLSAAAYASNDCLPVDMPSPDDIFAAPRVIFAHYLYPFPLSIDNQPADRDYYAVNYLSPAGESNKWLAHGGFLRSRPMPAVVADAASYAVDNMKTEVAAALSRGIGGFTFDIMTPDNVAPGGPLDHLLQAAGQVDPRFRILPMPDMGAMGPDTGKVLKIIAAIYGRPGLFHLPDGRLAIAPFAAENVKPADWRAMRAQAAKMGYRVAFLPTFLSLPSARAEAYAGVADGLGTFGTAAPGQGVEIAHAAARAHRLDKPFMAGVSGQDYRPKDDLLWEAGGSLAYRQSWLGAIEGNAEWVQLTTWNDFSESTQIEPYTDAHGAAGSGFFDLTGYYAAWYLTGKAAPIVRDALYYFYRRQTVPVAAQAGKKPVRMAAGSPPAKNMIELAGFLTRPGIMSVSIGSHRYSIPAKAGLQIFDVPLDAGTPRFTLSRGGVTVLSIDGNPAIAEPEASAADDLTYWSGGGACSMATAGGGT